jgi:hypothetical protein
MGPVFKCDQAEDCLSAVMGEILNDGVNRFTCFQCDFDLCKMCVRKQLKRVGSRTPSNISAASSVVNIYDNPGGIQIPVPSRHGSVQWERDSRRTHHRHLQARLSTGSAYDLSLGATAASTATAEAAAAAGSTQLSTAGGFIIAPQSPPMMASNMNHSRRYFPDAAGAFV